MRKVETSKVIEPCELPKEIKESLEIGEREEAEARDKLVRGGVIEPGQKLTLPARLILGLRTRRKSTY